MAKTRITHVKYKRLFYLSGPEEHPQTQPLRRYAGDFDDPEGESQKLRRFTNGFVIS